MNAVSKQCLFAGRQQLGSVIRDKVELFGQTIDGITDTNLPGGGSHEHGKHEGLIISDGHELTLVGVVRPARGLCVAGLNLVPICDNVLCKMVSCSLGSLSSWHVAHPSD